MSVTIAFEFYEATYEANAVDVWDYDYEEVFAYDSHNGEVDVCERIYLTDESGYINGGMGDSVNEMCCTPAEREALVDGCDLVFEANGWDTDYLPESCETADGPACSGIVSDIVGIYMGEYDACDYSYNCAEQVTFEATMEDTTPPVIGCSYNSEGGCEWEDAVEKCTYFDIPDLEAMDYVDTCVSIGYSVTYGGSVGECASSSSGQSCSGGSETSDNEIDADTVGTYCIQWDAVDDSGNWATTETFVVVVADTTTPGIYLETESYTIECAVESSVPCASASSDNLPCSDEPEVEWDNSDVDLDSVGFWEIVYETNDGHNDASATFSLTIEDTTYPTITCPNDYVYEYNEDYMEGSSDTYDSCSETHSWDDQYEVYPVEDGVVAEIGTYYATYSVADAIGWTSTCQQEVVVQDTTPPECEFVDEQYVTVEACTGSYTESWVVCYDDYDEDVNDEVWCGGDCNAVDEMTVGTYAITYGVTDVNGNSATVITRYIVVEDTTDPELTLEGESAVVLEASNPMQLEWNLGAMCTDTCPFGSDEFIMVDDDYESTDDVGCADGTREGFDDMETYLNVAACAGDYSDNIDYGDDGGLCADGWSVCNGETFYALDMSFDEATAFGGCFAYNSASDCNACYETCEAQTSVNGNNGCWDSSGGFDMDGVGSGCGYITSSRTSCMTDGMIRAADNAGCSWDANAYDSSATGIVCCRDDVVETETPVTPSNHRSLLSTAEYELHLEFAVATVAYSSHSEYTSDWEFDESWFVCAVGSDCVTATDDLADYIIDEQQYYCGSEDTGDMDAAAEDAVLLQPTGGDTDVAGYLQGLSDACGIYEISYTCADAVGNSVTATQYVFTMDTIDPEIYAGTYAFVASAFTEHSTAAALGAVAGVAFVALVATKLRRGGYERIPL